MDEYLDFSYPNCTQHTVEWHLSEFCHNVWYVSRKATVLITQPTGVENDASAKPLNLSLASCDLVTLTFDLLAPTLVVSCSCCGPLAPTSIKIDSFVELFRRVLSIHYIHVISETSFPANHEMNGRTDKRTNERTCREH